MLKKLFGYPLLTLLLTACVTINIYFPAAAAEEAARTIVRDVLKSESEAPVPEAPSGGPQSGIQDAAPALVLAGRLLELLVPPAQAQQADININTPAIRSIRASLEKRQPGLAPHYASGAVGFDNDGSVAIRDLNAVPLAERNRLKKLVAEENADRARLYAEIARANGHPEWEPQVRSNFARVWVEEAPRGYWYRDGRGNWQRR
jgi:uncharacterized protein YdbL (DUF1318 family)